MTTFLFTIGTVLALYYVSKSPLQVSWGWDTAMWRLAGLAGGILIIAGVVSWLIK